MLRSIGAMSAPGYPQHGCIPAEPASVSPGEVLVAVILPAVVGYFYLLPIK